MYRKRKRFLMNKYYNSGLYARKLKQCLKFIERPTNAVWFYDCNVFTK